MLLFIYLKINSKGPIVASNMLNNTVRYKNIDNTSNVSMRKDKTQLKTNILVQVALQRRVFEAIKTSKIYNFYSCIMVVKPTYHNLH